MTGGSSIPENQLYAPDDSDTVQMTFEGILREAEAGSADAQYQLGLMHSYGGEAPKDLSKAAEWFARASDNGHPGASRELGVLLLTGQGVERDTGRAYALLSAAAANMDPRAMYHLGLMYENGLGTARDLYGALRMLGFAANMGYEGADADADRVEARIAEERAEKLRARPLGSLVLSDRDVESACCGPMLEDILGGQCYFVDTFEGPALFREEVDGERALEGCPHCGRTVENLADRR